MQTKYLSKKFSDASRLFALVFVLVLQGCGGGGGSTSDDNGTGGQGTDDPATVFDSDGNDEFDTADRVEIAGTFQGTINDTNDIYDYFLFVTPSGGDYDFSLKFGNSAVDLDIAVYLESRELHKSGVALNDITDLVDQVSMQPGASIYIRVAALNTGKATVPYTLNITDVTPQPPPPEDASENNGDIGSPSEISDDEIVGEVSDDADVNDYLKYSIPADGDYEFTLSWSDDTDLDLYVYDDQATLLGSAINVDYNPELVKVLGLSAGQEVLIRIHAVQTSGETVNYDLAITQAVDQEPPPVSSDVDDNGSPGRATPFSNTGHVNGTLQAVLDLTDYFVFYAPVEGDYRFQLDWPDKADDLDFSILDDISIRISSSNANTNIETISGFHMTENMRMYIVVGGYKVRSNGHRVPYKLSIEME